MAEKKKERIEKKGNVADTFLHVKLPIIVLALMQLFNEIPRTINMFTPPRRVSLNPTVTLKSQGPPIAIKEVRKCHSR